jgi:hypothetical protein
MNANDVVSLMAATIFAADPSKPPPHRQQLTYDGVANQAWDLYHAVHHTSGEAAERATKRYPEMRSG